MENKKDKQNSLIDFNVFAAMNTENCLLHVSSVSVTYVVFYHNTQPLSSREAQRQPLQQNSDEPNKAEQSMLPVQEGWIPCYKVWIRIHFLFSLACFWTLERPFHWLGRVVDRWELLSTVLHFRSHLRTSPIDRWDVGGDVIFHGSLQCWSRLLLHVRGPSLLTDSAGSGIECLPSVPAQLEVINTGNMIQRQETPLPPTEFRLNALPCFSAQPRTAWHRHAVPGQVDVSEG